MTDLELIKLKLLSHSKNMLSMAENKDWQQLSELDSMWQKLLREADDKYGNELDIIGEALLDDNQKIQDILKSEQKKLSLERQKNTHSTSSIKQYLK